VMNEFWNHDKVCL